VPGMELQAIILPISSFSWYVCYDCLLPLTSSKMRIETAVIQLTPYNRVVLENIMANW